jgi:hypothetical protein
MAANFVAASTQYLANAAVPFTAVPFTIALWYYPINTTTQTVLCLSDTGTTNNYFNLRKISTVYQLRSAAGGADASASAGTFAANAWTFIVARCISATNRRLAVLNPDGSAGNGQDTTSRAPSGIDTLGIGALLTSGAPQSPIDGLIGEFWCTNTDIQDDGLALQGAMLRQLAYGGPFSVPHIAKDIIEYHSFRKDLSSDTFDNEEDFLGGIGIGEVLTNTNGVTVGPHPPLPYWYERPRQSRRVLTI